MTTLALAFRWVRRYGVLLAMSGLAACGGGGGSATPGVNPPATPVDVTAKAGDASVVLDWSASSGATGYVVSRGTTSGGPYSQIATPTDATYTDTGLTNGTTYFYVIAATNAGGSSAESSQASATPTAPAAAPAAPQGLVASGGNALVSLQWDAVAGATGYLLLRSATSGGPYQLIASPSATTYDDTTVTNGATYYYVVTAYDAAGASANSPQASATPQAAPQAPGVPSNLSAIAANAQVALTWTASPGATSYVVSRATSSAGPYASLASPTVANYTDTQVTNGTTYYYTVAATNAAGSSAASAPVAATPSVGLGIPATPTALTAMPGNGQVSLSWAASAGATAYSVQRALASAGPYTAIGSPTSTAFTDAAVTNGTTYYYVVAASDAAGTSANSAPVSATPAVPVQIPATPAGLAATNSAGAIALQWSASSGATSYVVQRATSSGGAYTTIATPSTTSYSDASVSAGTTYYYVVAATDAAGSSAPTAPVSATTIAAVPTGLTAAGGTLQVTLAWTGSYGATAYNVKRSSTSGGPYSTVANTPTTAYTDASLSAGTTYYYEVSAVDPGGESANSAAASATTRPASPSGVTATPGVLQVSLAWSASGGATAYNVKRASASNGTFATVATPTGTSYTNTGLTAGVTYYYEVSALDAAGESANSSVVSATPTAPVQPPTTPTGVAASAANATVTISWAASTGASSYNVLRSTTSGGPYSQIGTTSASPFTDSSSANGTTYYYVVTATNSVGTSPNSTEVSATPLAPPTTPTALSAVASNSLVKLTWTGGTGTTNYAQGYNLYRASSSGGPYALIASPTLAVYTDAAVKNGSTYYYEVAATNVGGASALSAPVSASPQSAAVTITVTPTQTHKISPYIYGLNFYNTTTGAPSQLTLDRLGGNRWTAYNWTNNLSNAGSDYNYENDNYLSPTSSAPAAAVTSSITPDQAAKMATLITFQMQGLVANDQNTSINLSNPPSSDAADFKGVVFAKGSAFTTNPPASAPAVYMDEFLWNVNQAYPSAGIFSASPTGQPVFGSLDNEPELWDQTHFEVQGTNPIAAASFITKSISLASALKAQFPAMKIFGPVHYGFLGIYNWNYDPSENPTPSANNWFADQYIAAVQSASTPGHQLVDVYDFHWYPEATDSSGTRITYLVGGPSSPLTPDQVQAIVQSPRSLWDQTYTENSWIPGVLGGPIYILGRLQAKITAASSPMGLSITEYNNGGSGEIAGTIAQADNLGVFGAQGLFAATFWQLYTTEPYTLAGFTAFRNFDGAGSNFGDTSVKAVSSDDQAVTVYVSTDSSRPGRVVMVAINRSTAAQTTTVTGQTVTGTAHFYQLTAASTASQASPQPVAAGQQAASGTSINFTLPALSVTTIDIH